MKRSFSISATRCGDKFLSTLHVRARQTRGREWFSYINGSSEPGRPTNVYLPPSVAATALAGRELAPGDKVEIPLEKRRPDSCGPLDRFARLRPVRQSA